MRIFTTITAFFLAVQSASASPEFWVHEWPDTNFSNTSIENWVEILSGGPPKDGIPALDDPQFIALADADLPANEPVITVALAGEVPRAYPVRYLMWHEIVNDQIGDMPVAVTFCPLCNSGIVFDRRTAAGTLSFGVSGKLRNSDMIMYDRESLSWWQQATGTAIVGDLTGTQLRALPAWMESWNSFRAANPDGWVMAEPDFDRRYGTNPYESYDSSHRPFLYSGELPPHEIPALARVVRVGDMAWPLTRLAAAGALTEEGITLTWAAGQASALDAGVIGQGHDVGNIRVRDTTGNDIAHDVMFAFAFHAFWPDGKWMINPG